MNPDTYHRHLLGHDTIGRLAGTIAIMAIWDGDGDTLITTTHTGIRHTITHTGTVFTMDITTVHTAGTIITTHITHIIPIIMAIRQQKQMYMAATE